jgi:hypothetical protein
VRYSFGYKRCYYLERYGQKYLTLIFFHINRLLLNKCGYSLIKCLLDRKFSLTSLSDLSSVIVIFAVSLMHMITLNKAHTPIYNHSHIR